MSKLGYFTLLPYHGLYEELAAARVRIVKAGDPGVARELQRILGPDTIVIARNFTEDDDFLRWLFGHGGDPLALARYWVSAYRPAMQTAPLAYWESFNEMSNFAYMRHYAEFEAERQRLMAAEGFRAAVGNFSVGNPPMEQWPAFYPALAAAHEFRNILGLHEYGGLWLDMWYGPNQRGVVEAGGRVPFPEAWYEGWLFGRYRKVWKQHIEPHGWTNIRIALTELGLDYTAPETISALLGYPTADWRSCREGWARLDGRSDTEQFYAEQLMWADRQMQRDAYCVGGTIYCRGTDPAPDNRWRDYDVRGGVAAILDAYTSQTPSGSHRVTAPPGLRVRHAPTVDRGVVLTVLQDGATVTVLEPLNGWARIQTSSGLVGYAMSQYLQAV